MRTVRIASLFALVVACSDQKDGSGDGPRSVDVSGPASVGVFAGSSTSFTVSLAWTGTPAELTVSTTSAVAGITTSTATVGAGATAIVTVDASAAAQSGTLTLRFAAGDIADSINVPISVYTATAGAPPSATLLQGATFDVEVTVAGGTPTFPTAVAATNIGGAAWRVTLTTPDGDGTTTLTVPVLIGDVEGQVELSLDVTNTLIVEVLNEGHVGDAGVSVALTGGATQTTDGAGTATFTGVHAPYEVRVGLQLWRGLQAPAASIYSGTWPTEKSADVSFTLETPGGTPLSGHAHATVGFRIHGVYAGTMTYLLAGGATGSIDATWYSPESFRSVTARAVTFDADDTILGYGTFEFSVTDGVADDVDIAVAPVTPVARTALFVPPPGLTMFSKTAQLVFSDSTFDSLGISYVTGSSGSYSYQTIPGTGATLTIIGLAEHADGRSSQATVAHVPDTLDSSTPVILPAPPVLDTPIPAISPTALPSWNDEFTVYYVALNDGVTYLRFFTDTPALSATLLELLGSGAGQLTVCGINGYTSLDEYAATRPLAEAPDATRSYSSACTAVHNVFFQ